MDYQGNDCCYENMVFMNPQYIEFPKNNGGALYYFGNRNLTLPDFDGHMKVDTLWLKETFSIITENRKGKKFNRCFEPFAGSAAWSLTAMELGFSNEYYINDGNKILIDFLQLVKNDPNQLKDRYSYLVDQYNKSDKNTFFLNVIKDYNLGDDFEKSLLIPFIINFSWGGMVFYDVNGSIRYQEHKLAGRLVPGYIDTPPLSLNQYFAEINRISLLLNNNTVYFQNGDFEHALANIDKDDFVILNPPYPENERSDIEKFGLYLEIHPREVLHEKLCNLIRKLESNDIDYFLSYGLYNPDLKNFLIGNILDQPRYYLRIIGSENCIFGRALDQVYLSKNLIIPKNIESKVIPAIEVLQNKNISHLEALEVFSRISLEKELSQNEISFKISIKS